MTTNNKIIVNTKWRVPFGVWIRVGPRNHAVGGNQQDPSCRNANLRDISRPIAKYGEPAACADGRIDVPFEMRTRERPRNHVFDGFALAPSGEYVRSILGRQRWANCARTDRDGFPEALTVRKLGKRCTGWGRGEVGGCTLAAPTGEYAGSSGMFQPCTDVPCHVTGRTTAYGRTGGRARRYIGRCVTSARRIVTHHRR